MKKWISALPAFLILHTWPGSALAEVRSLPALPVASQVSNGLHEVVVTGRGMTDEEALRAAFVVALERTVGTIIHSETTSTNFTITKDAQTLLTNGCIDSYDEISSGKSDGLVSKTIRARVRRGLVADWVKRSGWTASGDLSDTWARLATSIQSRKQALAMLHEKVPQIRDRLYKTALVDLATGREIDPSAGVPQPFTEENLDDEVLCVWAAALKPDFEFWETHAAPLLAACLDALCEKKARLFLNMDTAPAATGENISRAPWKRWQRIRENMPPPWQNAKPVTAPANAPHCIALETRTTHPECLDLTLYFLTAEVYERVMHPPEIQNAEGEVLARPERFNSLRSGLRAKIHLDNDTSQTFAVVQRSPLFHSMSLPWTGHVQASYCGPYFFGEFFADGWESKSAWPDWHGPVRPEQTTPGFAPFLIGGHRILRADGAPALQWKQAIANQRSHLMTSIPDWQTDSEVLVPLVFKINLSDLRRIRRLSVEPITGAPPVEPSLGDKFFKFLKTLGK